MIGIEIVYAARIKDVASVKGVRENDLIGYGIVVGLKGTGDSSSETTNQSLAMLYSKLGVEMKNSPAVKSKNVAAVIVTGKLPPFARMGLHMDVTVSSTGDASSLEGGVLLVTPLRAGDQAVYAVAQGMVSLGALIDGSSKGFPTVGRVIRGATIEKDVSNSFATKKSYRLMLHAPDFTTAARAVMLINGELGGKYASAGDGGTIDVIVPFNYEGNPVEFLARIENLDLSVDRKAKVVLNERTGTVVIGEHVQISPVALAHGDLAIEIKGAPKGSKPERFFALNWGDKEQQPQPVSGGGVAVGASVSDLVKGLNALGVQPKDLTAILQALREAGALQAVLEVI